MTQSKHTPVIYAAHCDTVRNQEPRINDAMPALRFQNGGQELAIITLSGYTKGKDINEMSQMEWAKHLAMCSNAHDDLVAGHWVLFLLLKQTPPILTGQSDTSDAKQLQLQSSLIQKGYLYNGW